VDEAGVGGIDEALAGMEAGGVAEVAEVAEVAGVAQVA